VREKEVIFLADGTISSYLGHLIISYSYEYWISGNLVSACVYSSVIEMVYAL